jgi:hypothetical protein
MSAIVARSGAKPIAAPEAPSTFVSFLPSRVELQHQLLGEAEPTQQEVEEAHRQEAQSEGDRLANLLGLAVASGKDSLECDFGSLGMQSRRFVLSGDRWEREGRVAALDSQQPARAHAKCKPGFGLREISNARMERARAEAEAAARELGKTSEDVKAAGDRAAFESDLGLTDIGAQLKRERTFLRAWAAAYDVGELELPADSLLVVPRLFDGVVVNSAADPHAVEREEEKPSVLVMEDLAAAGFTPSIFVDGISEDEGYAVSAALADFHAGTWRMRHRLGFAHFIDGDAASDLKHEQATRLALMHQGVQGLSRPAFQALLGQANAVLRSVKIGAESEDGEPTYIAAKRFEKHMEGVLDAMFDKEPGQMMLVHGDPWAHNLMFRRDAETGKVTGVALVDLAGYRPGVVATDLYGFITTSMNADVRRSGGGMKRFEEHYAARLRSQYPSENMFTFRTRAHAAATTLVYFTGDGRLWKTCRNLFQRFMWAIFDTQLIHERNEMDDTTDESESDDTTNESESDEDQDEDDSESEDEDDSHSEVEVLDQGLSELEIQDQGLRRRRQHG